MPDHISTNTITSSTLMVRLSDTNPRIIWLWSYCLSDRLCVTMNYRISVHCSTGSRIASWLPSFSVEVMHTTNILGIAQANNSQLMAMVRSSSQSNDFPVDFMKYDAWIEMLCQVFTLFLLTVFFLYFLCIKSALPSFCHSTSLLLSLFMSSQCLLC